MQYICCTNITHTLCKFRITIVLQGVNMMRKFIIPKIPPTTNKSIRFPNDVIEQVEDAIRGKDCTFTAFVIEAVRVALENLNEEQ